jgi:hypothetical protein
MEVNNLWVSPAGAVRADQEKLFTGAEGPDTGEEDCGRDFGGGVSDGGH